VRGTRAFAISCRVELFVGFLTIALCRRFLARMDRLMPSRYVADVDGGDRCECRYTGAPESSVRISDWLWGLAPSTIGYGRDAIAVTRGEHVHVELAGRSS